MNESSEHSPQDPEELPSLDFPWKTADEALEYRSRLNPSASRSEERAADTFGDMLDDLFRSNPALATEISLRMAASDKTDMRRTVAVLADLLYAADKESGWQFYIRLFGDDDKNVRELAAEGIELSVEEGLMTEDEARRLKDAYRTAEKQRFFRFIQRAQDGSGPTPPSAPSHH